MLIRLFRSSVLVVLMELTKSTRNIPIGELHNVHSMYGYDVDVKNEEIMILSTDACEHLNVVRLLDGRFVCLKCQEYKNKSFGINII